MGTTVPFIELHQQNYFPADIGGKASFHMVFPDIIVRRPESCFGVFGWWWLGDGSREKASNEEWGMVCVGHESWCFFFIGSKLEQGLLLQSALICWWRKGILAKWPSHSVSGMFMKIRLARLILGHWLFIFLRQTWIIRVSLNVNQTRGLKMDDPLFSTLVESRFRVDPWPRWFEETFKAKS